MPRVVALNNHPYGASMRTKDQEYDVEEKDLELMVSLKRVRVLDGQLQGTSKQQYNTRSMSAAPAGVMTTKTIAAPKPADSQPAPAAPAQPSASASASLPISGFEPGTQDGQDARRGRSRKP